jgi:hypothetical protein
VIDLDPVLVLMHELFLEDRLPDQRAFDSARARSALEDLTNDSSRGGLWLICDGDMAVGYVALTFGYSLEFYGRDAFIDEIYVQHSIEGEVGELARWDTPKQLRSRRIFEPFIWRSAAATLLHRRSTRDWGTPIMIGT